MKCYVLDAKEIFSVLQTLWHRDGDPGSAVVGPGELRTELGLFLVHLEPDRTRPIPCGSRLSCGHLGHVHLNRAGVIDVGVGCEADARAGRHIVCLRATHLQGITSDSCGCDVADEAIVLPMRRLDHVDPIPGWLTVGNQVWKGVFRRMSVKGSE